MIVLARLLSDMVVSRLGRSLEQLLRSTQHTIRLSHRLANALEKAPLARAAKVPPSSSSSHRRQKVSGV
jgi:hypothetical protein